VRRAADIEAAVVADTTTPMFSVSCARTRAAPTRSTQKRLSSKRLSKGPPGTPGRSFTSRWLSIQNARAPGPTSSAIRRSSAAPNSGSESTSQAGRSSKISSWVVTRTSKEPGGAIGSSAPTGRPPSGLTFM
jgi:hypothetical protein